MKTVVMVTIAAALVQVLGCGRAPTDKCLERTRALEAHLASLPTAGRSARSSVDWIASARLAVLDDAIEAADDVDGIPTTVWVTTDLRFRTVADAVAGLEDELRPGVVLVVPDRDATWVNVATVLEALRELGQTRIDVMFQRDVAVPRPPPATITDEINELGADSNDRPSRGASLFERATRSCPAVARTFEKMPDIDAAFGGLGAALRECNCNVDVEDVTALAHYVLAPDFVPAVVRLELAAKGERTGELVFAAFATWDEVAAQVVEARGRPLAFAWR